MESAEIEVSSFVWDALNEAKLAAHGVTPAEIESVRDHRPRFFTNAAGRSADYVMVGPAPDGRFFFAPIVPTKDPGVWYVVTAYRLARQRALRIYERGVE